VLKSVFDSIGKVALFGAQAIRDAFVPPFEGEYLCMQLYEIGVGSFFLVVASGFALGVVMTLHTRGRRVADGRSRRRRHRSATGEHARYRAD
jgi:phospholipid/cholesterol/gamma-HCH transport system permease protein